MEKLVSIAVPGSKSLSNRALILSILCNKQTTLKNVALCDDTNYTIKALRQFGIKIHQDGTTVKIQGILQNGKLNFSKKKKTIRIFTGNAGTTTRFLTALAPLTGNEIIIDGDARMRERPIKELVKALNSLGAKIKSSKGRPPLKIQRSRLNGGEISLPGNISSQYLSAVLMVAPFATEKTTINIEQKLYSKPYIKMTIKMMNEFGLKVVNKNFRQFIIKPIVQTSQAATKAAARATEKLSNLTSPQRNEQNRPIGKKTEKIQKIFEKTYTIESDASSASYFGAYAALHPEKRILLQNIHKNSLQGDIKFLDYLKKMGCKTVEQKNGTIIQGPRKLKSLGTIDMNETPDLVMTFAVLALFTKGKTKITNIGNLRIKETDRLVALENEIKKLANALNLKKLIAAKIGKDWIEIYRLKSVPGDKLKNKDNNSQFDQIYRLESPDVGESQEKSAISQAIINTYNDHRIAMSFGILTDIFPFLKIENPSCVSKSYTTFWKDLKKCQDLKPLRENNS